MFFTVPFFVDETARPLYNVYMEVFRYRKPNIQKLEAFGFVATPRGHRYRCSLADGQLELTVTVAPSGAVTTLLLDQSSGEEYVLHRIPGAAGAFVGRVREEYEGALEQIARECFDPEVFKSPQTKQVLDFIAKAYGDQPEFLWPRSPANAIVRRKDTQKWYAAFLTLSRRKLGLNSDRVVEIVDLRLAPAQMEATVDHQRYFPGFHMNKKHWITVCLDGTVPVEEICARVEDSYRLARK